MLRNLQGVIGAWHDWDALAGETRKARHGSAGSHGLIALLEELADESLTKAVHACEQTMGRLHTLLADKGTQDPTAAKRRVQAAAPSRAMTVLRRA